MPSATTTATPAGFTSSLSGLPDQVLLAHTRSLVLHEQALALAVLDHLREIHARHLHLRLGFSSLFDYAVRELGYSEGAAWRRIKAMRLCSETAGSRERLQDGSLTLSAAALLQNTFECQQRTATAAADPGSAPAAPELLPGATGKTPGAGALGGETAASARPAPVLDAAQRQELVAQASGKSTREVKQLLAGVAPELARPAERMRALGEDRWELKVVIDAACQRGIEQLRALLSHVDPHLTVGQLVERLVQDGLQRYDPGRPRRGRGGGRREASAGQAPEPKVPEPNAPEPRVPAGAAGRATSPAKRGAQELPGVPPTPQGTSAGGSTPAPVARPVAEPARRMGGAGTSAVATLPAPLSGRGGSTPVSAKPAATAPDTATLAKSAADREPHATVPTPRPTLPADQSMPAALAAVDRGRSAPSPARPAAVDPGRGAPSPAKPAAVDPGRGAPSPAKRTAVDPGRSAPSPARPAAVDRGRGASSPAKRAAVDRGRGAPSPAKPAAVDPGRSAPSPAKRAAVDPGRGAPSPAKRAGVARLDGQSRQQPEAAGPSGGSAQPPRRARRSRYIPASVRREVWCRDGGCCSYVDPHSGRRCGSRFLLELDHIVPFALGGSAEPQNLRVRCTAHHRLRHREYGPPPVGAT